MPRTVWILGAGFSRSLGGPLLNQMLTPASDMQVRAAFPPPRDGDGPYRPLYCDAANIVQTLYGTFGPNGDGNQHWSDAEVFLEALDVAATAPAGSASAAVLERLVKQVRISGSRPDAKTLANAARRLLAAECSAFLKDADPATEKWAPYQHWVRALRPGDAVVSFNYDLVVETARDAIHYSNLVEVIPGSAPVPESDAVPLLKLHGSVDWKLTPSGVEKSKNKDFALTCREDELVIASPGPTKLHVVQKCLAPLWEAAITSIARADVVVFVGYRFPPSDSQARRRLFMALTQNQATANLFLRVVLGPDTGHKDVLRLKGILEYAMAGARRVASERGDQGRSPKPKQYTLRVHPLGAEDFLDVFADGHLNQPEF